MPPSAMPSTSCVQFHTSCYAFLHEWDQKPLAGSHLLHLIDQTLCLALDQLEVLHLPSGSSASKLACATLGGKAARLDTYAVPDITNLQKYLEYPLQSGTEAVTRNPACSEIFSQSGSIMAWVFGMFLNLR